MNGVLCLLELGNDALNEGVDGFRVTLFNFKDVAQVVLDPLEFLLLISVFVKLMANLVDVVNRIEDLMRFFLRLVLHTDLVLEFRVQLCILGLYFLNFILNLLHFLALVVHLTGHNIDLALLVLKDFLALSSNQRLPFFQPLVFFFEVNEALAKPHDALLVFRLAAFRFVGRSNDLRQLLVFNDLLQEGTELFVRFQLLLAVAQFIPLF